MATRDNRNGTRLAGHTMRPEGAVTRLCRNGLVETAIVLPLASLWQVLA